ncbi:MAG: AAA family ATPase [Candidatus Brocadiia bacterium]
MKSLIRSLMNGESPDPDAFSPDGPAFLARLQDYHINDQPLLECIRRTVEALFEDPPPEPEGEGATMRPWWSPTPAACLAALMRHAALPPVADPDGGMPPHAKQSASMARELLRTAGCPFEVREHTVALIRNARKPDSLLGSGALAETYMQFACGLDLRTLYSLRMAEAHVANDEDEQGRLEAFHEHVEQLGVFAAPPAPPLSPQEVAELGYDDPAERHRALNALRYFRLVARMTEPDWYAERLREERGREPCRLNVVVGPAGSGKSTWVHEHLSDTVIVSSDRMRRELTGDPADQSQNYLVFQRCMDRIREELHRGREVTFDATNYSEKLRTMPLQAGRWSGAEICSYLMDVGLREALRRNEERERRVPEDVIRRHYRGLELPALYEADRHFVVGPDGKARQYWPDG